MKAALRQFEARINAMQLRERMLLLLAGITAIFFLVDTFGLQPAYRQHKQYRQDISVLETDLEILRQRSRLLYESSEDSPLLQRNRLQTELAELESSLQNTVGSLLSPDHASKVLKQVLAQEQGLKLREVEASSRPLTGEEPLSDTATPLAGIGRYDLQLQFEGNYLATLRYLRALDSLPWIFFWENVEFETTSYPLADITLNIYTLGLIAR